MTYTYINVPALHTVAIHFHVYAQVKLPKLVNYTLPKIKMPVFKISKVVYPKYKAIKFK